MNKILFSLLLGGVSICGIQGAFAAKHSHKSPEARDGSSTPRSPAKIQKFPNLRMVPCTPMKPSARSFGHARVLEAPNQYEMREDGLWKLAPILPISSCTSSKMNIKVYKPILIEEHQDVLIEANNPRRLTPIAPVPPHTIRMRIEGGKLFLLGDNDQNIPVTLKNNSFGSGCVKIKTFDEEEKENQSFRLDVENPIPVVNEVPVLNAIPFLNYPVVTAKAIYSYNTRSKTKLNR